MKHFHEITRYDEFVSMHHVFLQKQTYLLMRKTQNILMPDEANQQILLLAWEGFLCQNCKDEDKRFAFVRGYICKKMPQVARDIVRDAQKPPEWILLQMAKEAQGHAPLGMEMEHQMFMREIFRNAQHILKEAQHNYSRSTPEEQKKTNVLQCFFSPLTSETDVTPTNNTASLEFYSKAEFAKMVGVKWKTCQIWLRQFLEKKVGLQQGELFVV